MIGSPQKVMWLSRFYQSVHPLRGWIVAAASIIWLGYIVLFTSSHPPVSTYSVVFGVLVVVMGLWPPRPDKRLGKIVWLTLIVVGALMEITSLFRDKAEQGREKAEQVEAQRKIDTVGDLLPADDPDPFVMEGCNPPPQDFKVYLGTLVHWDSQLPVLALRVGDTDFVNIQGSGARIGIDAHISAKDGTLLATITDNRFMVNPNSASYHRSPDPHTLEVLDNYGNVALHVRFLNKNAVQIWGTFYTAQKRALVVTKEDARIGQYVYSHECAGKAFFSMGVAAFTF